MIGCAVGALEATVLPAQGPGFWALVSMGAILGGTMRAPLTGVFFTLEDAHEVGPQAVLAEHAENVHQFGYF
jgi:H+/Cl- antiporter ClcA